MNLKGREPQGVVERGKEHYKLLDEIERELHKLVDPVTENPAVHSVGRTSELFGCGPHTNLPGIL